MFHTTLLSEARYEKNVVLITLCVLTVKYLILWEMNLCFVFKISDQVVRLAK